MQIILKPVITNLDTNTLYELAKEISIEFKDIKVIVASSSELKDYEFQFAFDTHRNQWNSPKLLDWFYDKFKPNKDRVILVIMDVEAYSDGLNFVLGEAFPEGGLGAVYLARIKEEFYGLRPNDKLFYQRMVKECVHELGHLFRFVHCPYTQCDIHSSNTLRDTDVKRKSFCGTCRMKNPIF